MIILDRDANHNADTYIAKSFNNLVSSYRQRADGPLRLSVSLPPKWTANYRTAIHAVNIKTIGCTCQREQYGGRFGSKLTHIVKFLSQTVFRKSVIFYRFSFVCLNKCQTGFYVSNEITRVKGKYMAVTFLSCIIGMGEIENLTKPLRKSFYKYLHISNRVGYILIIFRALTISYIQCLRFYFLIYINCLCVWSV